MTQMSRLPTTTGAGPFPSPSVSPTMPLVRTQSDPIQSSWRVRDEPVNDPWPPAFTKIQHMTPLDLHFEKPVPKHASCCTIS